MSSPGTCWNKDLYEQIPNPQNALESTASLMKNGDSVHEDNHYSIKFAEEK